MVDFLYVIIDYRQKYIELSRERLMSNVTEWNRKPIHKPNKMRMVCLPFSMFARIVCIAREYVSCCASFAHTQHTAFVFAICYFFIYIFFLLSNGYEIWLRQQHSTCTNTIGDEVDENFLKIKYSDRWKFIDITHLFQ